MDKTVEQIYTDVVELVKNATGLETVIRGNQDGPQPTGEYASVLLTGQTQVGIDSEVTRDAKFAVFSFEGSDGVSFDLASFDTNTGVPVEVDVTANGTNAFTFSIQFFRGTPQELARRLTRYHMTAWGQDDLYARKIVIQSVSDPLDTSYKISQKWVQRASIQMVVYASSEWTKRLSVIGEVDLVVNKEESFNIK